MDEVAGTWRGSGCVRAFLLAPSFRYDTQGSLSTFAHATEFNVAYPKPLPDMNCSSIIRSSTFLRGLRNSLSILITPFLSSQHYLPVAGLVASSAVLPANLPRGFFVAPPRALPMPFLRSWTSYTRTHSGVSSVHPNPQRRRPSRYHP